MTETRLAACRQPDRNLFEVVDDDQRVVFAVAFRHGVAQNHVEQTERAAHAVLYLTRDGEQATSRWVSGTKDDLSAVGRAMIVPESALDPANDEAKRFAPITRRHPEV